MAGDARITNTSLKFMGINYFRGHAPSVRLGSFGEKKEPLTQQNYLHASYELRVPRLKVRRATTVRIDYTGNNAFAGALSVLVPGLGKLSPSVATEQLRHDKLALVKLDVLPGDIIQAMNDSPAALAQLKACGKKGRIVHQVFIVLEARTAKNVSTHSDLELMATNGQVKLNGKFSHGSTSDLELELSPGSTLAYLLLEPKWDARKQKDWKRIVGSDDDQLGPV